MLWMTKGNNYAFYRILHHPQEEKSTSFLSLHLTCRIA